MKDIDDLIIKMFNHFSAEQKLAKYATRKKFIEQFTPTILALHEKYSDIVEQTDIELFGFTFVSTIYFEQYKKSFFDKNDNMIEFDFKNRIMSISNANNEYHYLIQNATVNDLNTFYCIMYSLGFSCV